MKTLIIYLLLFFNCNTVIYTAEQNKNNTVIATTTVHLKGLDGFINSLTTEELVTLLSIGKIKVVTDAPHIASKLQDLQEQISASFETLYAEQLIQYNLSQDAYEQLLLTFQQKMAYAFYTLLYERTKERINLNNPEEQVLLNFQLTPEELENYLAQQ